MPARAELRLPFEIDNTETSIRPGESFNKNGSVQILRPNTHLDASRFFIWQDGRRDTYPFRPGPEKTWYKNDGSIFVDTAPLPVKRGRTSRQKIEY